MNYSFEFLMILCLIGAIVSVYQLFYKDSGETSLLSLSVFIGLAAISILAMWLKIINGQIPVLW